MNINAIHTNVSNPRLHYFWFLKSSSHYLQSSQKNIFLLIFLFLLRFKTMILIFVSSCGPYHLTARGKSFRHPQLFLWINESINESTHQRYIWTICLVGVGPNIRASSFLDCTYIHSASRTSYIFLLSTGSKINPSNPCITPLPVLMACSSMIRYVSLHWVGNELQLWMGSILNWKHFLKEYFF